MDQRTREVIEAENDPRVLKALIASMAEHIEKQKALLDAALSEKAKAAQTTFLVEEKVKLLRRELFGRSRENRPEALDRPRDKSQEQALLFSQAAFPSLEKRTNDGKTKGHDLDEVHYEYGMTDSELVAESELRGYANASANQWKDTGLFEESTKIQIIERSYVREIHRRKKYKLIAGIDLDKEVIITAAGPDELLPGMNYTTDFVAGVVADKYISHVPLERQTREMESLGLKGIKNSTLSRHCALAAASLEPIQGKILQELCGSDLALNIDETPWKIQNKDEKDGFMWVISNRTGSYYFFKPTRSAQVIREKLMGYDGPVVTDGFTSYDKVLEDANIPHAYCWAHARREFLPLEDHDPTVKPILDKIDRLFEIEREATSFEMLGKLRTKNSAIVLDELESLLLREHPKSRDGSQKRKAIIYLQSRWKGFTMFLSDTRIPLSNNEAERTIRHAVVGRKNYYGSGNHSGADTAATLFTIIESCKKNDIDPRSYVISALHDIAAGRMPLTPLELARKRSQHV